MALIKCAACEKDISENAKSCPHCGEPLREQPTPPPPAQKNSSCMGTGCLATVAGLGVMFIIIMIASGGGGGGGGGPINSSPPPTNDTHSKGSAWQITQTFIERRLKSPSTAEFPRFYQLDDDAIEQDGRNYIIDGYVDSENAFGATLRQNFTIEVQYDGDGKWNLISLEFE